MGNISVRKPMFAISMKTYRYREILYSAYHDTQAGRSQQKSGEALLLEQKYYLRKEFESLLPQNKQARILDIGCGYGAFVSLMHDLGYENALGVDLSENQIKFGQSLGIEGLQVADLTEFLNKQQTAWDCITGLDIIEHFSKDELVELLFQLKKSLNPGGRLLFRTPNADAAYSSLFASGDFTHECILNKSSALQLFQSCGMHTEVYPSLMFAKGIAREWLRKILWKWHLLQIRAVLFATARTWHQTIFSPNLIISARLPSEH
jgi:2-polyprenyl-3-methyl-5-hydroxy-6-metoxy-1,4-benzoquinol methylase